MQTIPSNLNPEELLRWYDSTWNKLTNSEMEQRLADALKEVLDELGEANAALELSEEVEEALEAEQEKNSNLRAALEEIKTTCERIE